MMTKHTVYLALGTNLGNRLANLQSALASLPPDVKPLRVSPVYETPPWGYTDQPAFLNLVLSAETRLAPRPLLRYLKQLEADLGRVPTFRYGPRQIDLDILFYDNLILNEPDLIIPHPRLHERTFVLVPLADIAADLCHPLLGKTIGELLAGLNTADIHRFA
ncbi:MAG: 2-amino-4-hydroxy-6-hydroxymethyldihydropteridine diphosphokinase [Anaerolineae bacterium]